MNSRKRITAVMRAGEFSPNHVGNDAAIMHLTVEQLRKRGYDVNILTERQFVEQETDTDIIVTMGREMETVHKLCRLEDEGKVVVNSGYGILNGTRERMTRVLMNNDIPYPESLIVDTNVNIVDDLRALGIERCWLKRGENFALHREDVTYCRHPEEAQEVLHEFFYRGIGRAVINRHLEGDLVKFYGIGDGSFFHWFYPLEDKHSKFGDELINGMPREIKFDVDSLRKMCDKASLATDIFIYGGDCIIAGDGTFQIIDFNDWPSFAPCRDEAAPLIARAILGKAAEKFGRTPRRRKPAGEPKTGKTEKKAEKKGGEKDVQNI